MKPTIFTLAFPALLSLCLLSGCDTTPMETTQAPHVDFTQYKSFAVVPVAVPASVANPDLARALVQAAHDAAVAALASKGYAETSTNQAGFLVSIEGQSLPRNVSASGAVTEVQTARVTATVVGGSGNTGYDDRTLRVLVVDPRSGELIWNGWTTRISSTTPDPNNVRYAVARILGRFPTAVSR